MTKVRASDALFNLLRSAELGGEQGLDRRPEQSSLRCAGELVLPLRCLDEIFERFTAAETYAVLLVSILFMAQILCTHSPFKKQYALEAKLGSWSRQGVGQYPPALSKLIAKRRNFAQIEDRSFFANAGRACFERALAHAPRFSKLLKYCDRLRYDRSL